MQKDFEQYENEVQCSLESDKMDNFLNSFKTLDEFEEQEATWLIPGWIPEGQIALMAADGGIGKTSLWVNIVAAISQGSSCILDSPRFTRNPAFTIFFTTEDSIRKKLRKKLRLAGANLKMIFAPDYVEQPELLHDLKFGSPKIASLIRWYHPALCVFDPIQGFIPPKTNMASRNEMRDCLAPLIALGEETKTSFLLVCHTNKRKGVYGRDRIADSADLWDIARSVMMSGYTEDEGIRYLSNEKNNYDRLQETILFSIDDNGQVRSEGRSWKRDREFMQENTANASAPKRESCKEWLLHELDEAGGTMPSKNLEDRAKLAGYRFRTLRRAKEDLIKAGEVKSFQTGGTKNKVWYIQRTEGFEGFIKLPKNTPTPWPSDTSPV